MMKNSKWILNKTKERQNCISFGFFLIRKSKLWREYAWRHRIDWEWEPAKTIHYHRLKIKYIFQRINLIFFLASHNFIRWVNCMSPLTGVAHNYLRWCSYLIFFFVIFFYNSMKIWKTDSLDMMVILPFFGATFELIVYFLVFYAFNNDVWKMMWQSWKLKHFRK